MSIQYLAEEVHRYRSQGSRSAPGLRVVAIRRATMALLSPTQAEQYAHLNKIREAIRAARWQLQVKPKEGHVLQEAKRMACVAKSPPCSYARGTAARSTPPASLAPELGV